MKKAILFFAFMATLMPNIQRQTFASTEYPANKEITVYSNANFASSKGHRKMCTVAKVGIITGSVGGVISIVGLAFLFQNDGSGSQSVNSNQGDLGLKMLIGGAVLSGVGLGLGIGGGIHDIVNYHKHKLSIATPKRNQFGLAYNF